jgi:putative Holliday junction resolvase
VRVLAIDFGEARIGLAISDPQGRLAVPLTTLARRSDRQVIEEIRDIVAEEEIEHLILGEPCNLDGSRGDAADRVRSFRRKLCEQIPLSCDLVDESLTSVEAAARLRTAGADLRRQPERIDAVAAQILLEQFLARRPAEPGDG